MINLNIQINALLFSFLYGIFLALVTSLNYKFLYTEKNAYKIIFTLVFVVINVLLYFIGLRMLADAIIHSYFIIMLILGVIVEISIKKVIVKYVRK